MASTSMIILQLSIPETQGVNMSNSNDATTSQTDAVVRNSTSSSEKWEWQAHRKQKDCDDEEEKVVRSFKSSKIRIY